ncbi:MAG: glycosyltransferase [Candidatus Omnitrophica bacterium]|nr:glycosyltransferase [Candidatus Omnitrophota bacterium]MDD5429412.1 glycosyltransferase [Candidatus Omnitrophota bacterium]
MKILQVHNYYQHPGGEDEVFSSEVAVLRQYGEKVITCIEDNRKIRDIPKASLALRTAWSWPFANKLKSILKKEKPDIVHFHNTFPLISPSAYYACKSLGIPVIKTLHNYRLICPGAVLFREGMVCEHCVGRKYPWAGTIHACYRNSHLQTAYVNMVFNLHRCLKTWSKQVDIYIALTRFARNKYIQGGLPKDKIIVKPNFIYSDPGVSERDKKYVVFVGRLAQEKGIRTLLHAWRRLEGIPLKIAGDGPMKQKMEELARVKGIKNIEFLGSLPHDRAVELMKRAYCLVLPSEWYECFSVTLIEAFACGIPVIASRIGAMAEIIKGDLTGIFFKPGDSADLAEKVKRVWDNADEAEKIGKRARLEYEDKYSAKKNYELLMSVYKMAIDKKVG